MEAFDIAREIEEILAGPSIDVGQTQPETILIMELPGGLYRIPLPGREYSDYIYTYPRHWEFRGDAGFGPAAKSLVEFAERLQIIKPQYEHLTVPLIREGNKQAMWALMAAAFRPLFIWALIVKRWARFTDLEVDDLTSEGFFGLKEAATRYDPDKGQFSTYAKLWAIQRMWRAVANYGSIIRLPAHIIDALRKCTALVEEIWSAQGKPPSLEQLAAALGLSAHVLRGALEAVYGIRVNSLCPGAGQDYWELLWCFEYLRDDHIPGGPKVLEGIPSDSSIDEIVLNRELKCTLRRALNTLKPREQTVLRLRYGLDDGVYKTLEEVGRFLSVTRERVRQLESKALKRLRHPSHSKNLRALLKP